MKNPHQIWFDIGEVQREVYATYQHGTNESQRCGVIELLNHDLADAYLLLIETRKYHWDVVGPQFRSLHELWQEQYEALAENVDDIAERVRTWNGRRLSPVCVCERAPK